MKDSTKFILNAMNIMTESMNYGLQTPKEAEKEFLKQVNKNQLEFCLTDETLDAEDIAAVKEMLKYFFNYEQAIN